MSFISRVRKEHADLAAKQQKLCDFIAGPVFPTLHTTDQHLLIMQRGSMETYLGILALRLERAGPEEPSEPALGEPVETGGHDIDRDGSLKFDM